MRLPIRNLVLPLGPTVPLCGESENRQELPEVKLGAKAKVGSFGWGVEPETAHLGLCVFFRQMCDGSTMFYWYQRVGGAYSTTKLLI